MKFEIENINRYECRLSTGTNKPEAILIQPLHIKELDNLETEANLIAETCIPFAMAAITIKDWALELMPWHDPNVARQPEIGQYAHNTLNFITNTLLPYLNSRYGKQPVILGGYSLAALFALWSATQVNNFDSIAAASPSVWIKDWNKYISNNTIHAQQIYLSLGDREHITKNQAIAKVANNIRQTYQHITTQIGKNNTTLQWNKGSHFNNEKQRTADAFSYCLIQISKKRKPLSNKFTTY